MAHAYELRQFGRLLHFFLPLTLGGSISHFMLFYRVQISNSFQTIFETAGSVAHQITLLQTLPVSGSQSIFIKFGIFNDSGELRQEGCSFVGYEYSALR